MEILSSLARELKDIPSARALLRLVDKKPLQCSMYVTDRCNLACGYCSEYDNSGAHPPLDILMERISKVADLGTLRLALVGGEPLLHPDIAALIRFGKRCGLSVSLSTNGVLLDDAMIEELERAGLDVIQLSIDRNTASRLTQKSIENISFTLEKIKRSPVKVHISGVLCADTSGEMGQVLSYGLEKGIPVEFRLMHGDLEGHDRVPPVSILEGTRCIGEQIRLKKAGKKVHTSPAVLRFQMGKLNGRMEKWTCLAGYKVFFVSTGGDFWPCPLYRSSLKLEDVTLNDLQRFNYAKKCQPQCGITCVVSHSLFVQHPFRFLGGEIASRARQMMKGTALR